MVDLNTDDAGNMPYKCLRARNDRTRCYRFGWNPADRLYNFGTPELVDCHQCRNFFADSDGDPPYKCSRDLDNPHRCRRFWWNKQTNQYNLGGEWLNCAECLGYFFD